MAIPKVKISFDADFDDLKRGVKGATTEVSSFGDKVGEFGKKAGAAFAVAGAAAVAFAGKYAVDAIKAASDLSETVSKVSVTFGTAADDINAFAEDAAGSLGQTKQQALDAAATFGVFGKSAGLSGQELGKFSTDFTTLASDLASFNNTSPEDAINAIGSALRGEAEPLRKYGVLLDDATLKNAALELGLISTTKNALTPQQKVLAAQKVIYEQTTLAQGDFARTSGGLANQQRILSAEFTNLQTNIGSALLPVVLNLITEFRENLMPTIKNIAEQVMPALKTGFNTFVIFYKGALVPVFTGIKDAFNNIGDTIEANKDKITPFLNLLKGVVSFVVNHVAPVIGTVLGASFKVIGSIISGAIKLIAGAMDAIVDLVNGVIKTINLAIRAYNAVQWGTDIKEIKEIGGSTPIYSSGGAKSMSSGAGSAASSGAISVGVTGGGTPGGTTGKASGSGSALVITAPSITSSDYAQRNAGVTNQFNITGAIDPESTARQIIELLNGSAYRGSGGANQLVMV